MPLHPDTRAVHAGRGELASLGVHALPLDLSSTYPVRDLPEAARSIGRLSEGLGPVPGESIYARLHNPTVARFEEALAALEGGQEAVAFSSGMAALSACLLAARERGTEVVAVRPLYGGTDHLLASEMLGISVRWAEADGVAQVVGPRTAMVIVETPSNPTLDLVDLRELVRQAGDVAVLVDNTFATPVLQTPLELGATLVVHSATKFLGGHGDVVGGVVATDSAWAAALRRVRVATGGILHPLAAYLLHRGLTTLPIRVERAQQSATILAARLAVHPLVSRVLHPSRPGSDPAGLIGTQMRGPGALLAFEVEGGFATAAAVMREVRLMTAAVSLGSVDTLIQHPASLTHQVVEKAARERAGIGVGLLRVSVGLEDPDDLWLDLDEALHRACSESVHGARGR